MQVRGSPLALKPRADITRAMKIKVWMLGETVPTTASSPSIDVYSETSPLNMRRDLLRGLKGISTNNQYCMSVCATVQQV